MECTAWNTLKEATCWRKLIEGVNSCDPQAKQKALEKAERIALEQLASASSSTLGNQQIRHFYYEWLDKAEDLHFLMWEVSKVNELIEAEQACSEAFHTFKLAAPFATPRLSFWFDTYQALTSSEPYQWKLVELEALLEELLLIG